MAPDIFTIHKFKKLENIFKEKERGNEKEKEDRERERERKRKRINEW